MGAQGIGDRSIPHRARVLVPLRSRRRRVTKSHHELSCGRAVEAASVAPVWRRSCDLTPESPRLDTARGVELDPHAIVGCNALPGAQCCERSDIAGVNAADSRAIRRNVMSLIRSYEQRRRAGRAVRDEIPLESHAGWKPSAPRPDPLERLMQEDQNRLADLVPVRYGRMSLSPFTFLRGAASVMADDLATIPSTEIRVRHVGTRIWPTSGSSARQNGTCSSTSRISTKPCQGRGNGM